MKKRVGNLVVVLLVAGLVGCATSGRKIDQGAADQIEKGKTTKEQVVALIGSPESISRSSNGDTTYIYNYTPRHRQAHQFCSHSRGLRRRGRRAASDVYGDLRSQWHS